MTFAQKSALEPFPPYMKRVQWTTTTQNNCVLPERMHDQLMRTGTCNFARKQLNLICHVATYLSNVIPEMSTSACTGNISIRSLKDIGLRELLIEIFFSLPLRFSEHSYYFNRKHITFINGNKTELVRIGVNKSNRNYSHIVTIIPCFISAKRMDCNFSISIRKDPTVSKPFRSEKPILLSEEEMFYLLKRVNTSTRTRQP